MNKKIFSGILVFLFAAVLLFSQDNGENFIEPYDKGSQTFSINGAMLLPLFIIFPNQSTVFVPFGVQLSLGGMGSLEWSTFINNRVSLGIGLAGSFAFTRQNNTYSLIPITANLTYNLLFSSFEIPFIFGAGLGINRVDKQVYFGPLIKAGTGFFYNVNAQWSMGIRFQYWLVPEIYFGDQADKTSYGNFMDIGLSAKFHF